MKSQSPYQRSSVSNLNADIYTTLHNHRPIQQSHAQTHTQQFIIHVLFLETNMNSYIKLFSLQNMNSYIKNWAKDAPFRSCSVYFSAIAHSRRKIGQKIGFLYEVTALFERSNNSPTHILFLQHIIYYILLSTKGRFTFVHTVADTTESLQHSNTTLQSRAK